MFDTVLANNTWKPLGGVSETLCKTGTDLATHIFLPFLWKSVVMPEELGKETSCDHEDKSKPRILIKSHQS